MSFEKFAKGMVVALASAAVAACSAQYSNNDFDGVPLAELDTSGPAPDTVSLAGPDSVEVRTGDVFTIAVDGDEDAVDLLRFALDGSNLKIGRANGVSKSKAIVRITMPSLQAIALGGSGTVDADRMTGNNRIAIGGSGTAKVAQVDSQTLKIAIGGSGSADISGRTEALNLAIGGSGSGRMAGLEAKTAKLSIAGSGDAKFASDGTVDANIAGSGDVTVIGSAVCKVRAVGSGTLTCKPGRTPADEA